LNNGTLKKLWFINDFKKNSNHTVKKAVRASQEAPKMEGFAARKLYAQANAIHQPPIRLLASTR